MKKLFINNQYKGHIKKFFNNTSTGLWLFALTDSDLAAIAIRDDEILKILTGGDVYIEVKGINIPAGTDADFYGEKIINN